MFVGYIVDHVNFNPTAIDCFTGLDITTKDFRVPFGLASALNLFLIIFILFLLEVKIDKPDKKLSFREEFGWVSGD